MVCMIAGVYQTSPFPLREIANHVFLPCEDRITAVYNFGRVIQLRRMFSDDPGIYRTDACLINWAFHLSTWKKPAIYGDGHVDEMLF
jgi:hypothetical protein